MYSPSRHTMPVRVTAAGFILLIGAGHFWAIDHLLGNSPARLVVLGGILGSLGVLVGGSSMLLLSLKEKWHGKQ